MQIPHHLNPYSRVIKKYMVQVIPNSYTAEVDETIDRAISVMVTKKDAENFIKFLQLLYKAGYDNAMESATKAMESHGIKMKVVPPKK